ncbi:MAG: hypothetical protein AB7U05_08340 [Mangrovibacterium sp.]
MRTTKNQWQVLILASILLFLASTKVTKAQEEKEFDAPFKYEVSVDLQHFFSDGYPDKVLFKINNIKDNQIKGAYRLGIGATYWVEKYKITHDNKNYELTSKEQRADFSISLGYELQKQLKNAVFYYGADLGVLVGINDNNKFYKTEEFCNLNFVPFAGVKIPLTRNLSVAFEGGVENEFNVWKGEGSDPNPDNRQKHMFYRSQIKLPYSLTFNFIF